MASPIVGSKGPCMGEAKPSTRATPQEESAPPPPPPPSPSPRRTVSLIEPSNKKKQKSSKIFRRFRNVCQSFPILTPVCKLPTCHDITKDTHRRVMGTRVTGTRVIGTFFGYRKGRVSFCLQENSNCLPTLLVELAMQTYVLQKEMISGILRIALECEKRAEKDKIKLIHEPLWSMYCNGKKSGYCVKRDASEEDLKLMELLRAVSMGAGVLPGNSDIEGPDSELAYFRAHFERVVGSKDSVTLYMLSPEENSGPELSVFFVRI